LYLKDNKNPGLIDGFTQSNVSLFLGPQFGEQNHVTKRSKTDPHSPGMYRAYVPTQNVDAFYQAFDIKKETVCISNLIKELKSGSFRLLYKKIPSKLGIFSFKK
jgi:predicted metalloendopeptidase